MFGSKEAIFKWLQDVGLINGDTLNSVKTCESQTAFSDPKV
jgi:hypothetical protein